ncbi:MAG: L-glutamate gamma-semialdehyde dehydrogenase [Armatimonadota bacterium]
MLPEFRNEPFTDFTDPREVEAFDAALAQAEAELGAFHPSVVGGEEITEGERFTSINPAQPDEVVGEFIKADAALAQRAVQAATGAFERWKRVDPFERARYLLTAAAELRRRKHYFSALMVLETGKSWVEADGDTAEAIDLVEFYGREMMRLALPQPLNPVRGEEVDLTYIPLGVGVVIPPWNFPCAIMAGMTTASMVAGNAVVLKPASTAPTVARRFCELLWEQGLPDGVVNFLPGPGGEMGDALTGHPKTRFISFTGSKEVGLHVHELAAKTRPGQIWIKRTVLEMGGKDFLLVDETADLDAAATGIVTSAFGYQGQKCSAGSRAILVEEIYDEVVERMLQRASELTVGPPKDRTNYMGPIIDAAAEKKILEYIDIGNSEADLLLGGSKLDSPGYFIEPTIFGRVDRNARIGQEEIFGPVLACIPAKDFEDAVEVANGTEFGLTGSMYSRNRARKEIGRRELHVGNLYFNRKCTGAMVGGHPFGGFNMSGTDSKAGGRDYLLLFTQAKSVAEVL